ncbi:MAG: tetratricopeptide repeat protein [Microscillaceae bacterium]|jgi:tetratricopeptide (TPR) repeat protein|nr:tetratricopeptide repeat protein [Microscillaceae bacterium]
MKKIIFCLGVWQSLLSFAIFAQTSTDYWNAGTQCLQNQNYACAVFNFEQALKLNPRYIQIYLNLGALYSKLGKFEEALTTYQQAIAQINALDSEGLQQIQELKNAGDSETTKDINDAIKNRKVLLAEIYYNRADTYLNLGKAQEAMNDYNMSIQTHAKLPEAFYNRGLLKRKNRDLSGAIQDYSQAIALDNKYQIAYKNRGLAYYLNREYAKAVKDYEASLQFAPQDAETYYNRGLAKMGLRDKMGACADWRKAQQMGSNRAAEALGKYCN